MSAHARNAYERRGILAIWPEALAEMFGSSAPENVESGDAVIVDIRGPLEQHAHPCFDSFEGITARVAAACGSSARAVILRFDSPGGEVSGCFECARALRAMCTAAGKQMHAYVEGDCCSAAYALASQCDTITLSETSLVGSIGIFFCREDITAANAARGLRVAVITSGARKADGHPMAPLTDAEVAATQTIVDSMAGVFFELVASGRAARGLTAESVAQLEAKVFHGASAVVTGLADQLGALTTVLATIASPIATKGRTAMAADKSPYETARAALEEAAKGEDANAAAAKRALAALDMQPEGDEPKKKDAPAGDDDAAAAAAAAADDDDDAKAAAAAGAEPDGDEPPKKEGRAAAAYRIALAAQKQTEALRAELAKRDVAAERVKLIASRPDLTAEMRSLLERAPMTLVREHIAAMPKLTGTLGNNPLAASAGVGGTRGELQGSGEVSHLPPGEKQALDARMGLLGSATGVRSTEHKLELGVSKFAAESKIPNGV
jgi:ClpP class serine protease